MPSIYPAPIVSYYFLRYRITYRKSWWCIIITARFCATNNVVTVGLEKFRREKFLLCTNLSGEAQKALLRLIAANLTYCDVYALKMRTNRGEFLRIPRNSFRLVLLCANEIYVLLFYLKRSKNKWTF